MSSSQAKIKLDDKKIRYISEIHIAPSVQYLDLSRNKITDFSGLQKYQNLIELNMDGNPILSFNGFPKLTRLKKLSLIDTPVSKLKNFKDLALIVAGTQIETINGESITVKDRVNSIAYGNIETNYNLISKGWLPMQSDQFLSPDSIETKQILSSTGNSIISDNSSSASSHKSKSDNISQKLIEIQEKDPISVRAVRIMRQNGISNRGIGQFLCDYFDDYKEINEIDNEKMKLKENLKENGKNIDDLARKRYEITSRNHQLKEKLLEYNKIDFINEAKILFYGENSNKISDEEFLSKLKGIMNVNVSIQPSIINDVSLSEDDLNLADESDLDE